MSVAAVTTLTSRESDVLCLMIKGKTNQQIADTLFIGKQSVRAVIRSINNKLGTPKMKSSAETRQATIDLALRYNLCDEPQKVDTINNLPHQTTTFIGRSAELAQLAEILDHGNHRLVTIVAPGGMGKTRLSLAIARRQLGRFPDGVFFVPLVSVTTAEGLINEIGQQIGLIFKASNRSPKQQLLDSLYDKNRLLILDNFEQIIAHSSVINDILADAPQLKIIVTSRERLGLNSERIFRLAGLSTKVRDAVDLFIDNLARFDYTVDESDSDPIKHICQLVGGMPLALILASNWIEVLSVTEIADEIASGLSLLLEDMQDIPSIHTVFDRTWKRLTDKQRNVFMKLSVCIGGFTRESASEIANANLIILKQLSDKSLIQQSDTRRYMMHELVRQYAFDQLTKSGELESTREHYITYFSEFVASREEQVKGTNQLESLYEIKADFPNIESAWYHAINNNDSGSIISMLDCLAFAGGFLDLDHIFEIMLAAVVNAWSESDQIHPRDMNLIQLYHADRKVLSVTVFEDVQKWLTIAEDYNFRKDIARAFYVLGLYSDVKQNPNDEIYYYQRATQMYEETDDLTMQAHCYISIAIYYKLVGDQENEGKYKQLQITTLEKSGNYFDLADALIAYANYFEDRGKYHDAIQQAKRALDIANEIKNQVIQANASGKIGYMFWLMGDFDQCAVYTDEAMRLISQANSTFFLATIYSYHGRYLAIIGKYEEAEYHLLFAYNTFIEYKLNFNASLMQWQLSMVYCGVEQFTKAKSMLHNPILQASENRVNKHIINVTPTAAIVKAYEGAKVNAVELIAFTFDYPKPAPKWMKHWHLVTDLLDDLKVELGARVYQEAWERGARLDENDVIDELVRWVADKTVDDLLP